MHNLDTAQLRRQAAASARTSQRRIHWSLFAIHGLLYLAALAAMAVVLVGMPWVFDALWNTIDLSLVLFGLFAGWGIGLMLHGASMVVDSSWAERQLRNRAAAGVVGRALLDDDAEVELAAKAKRNLSTETDFSLNDDGELVLSEADDSPTPRLKH
ncbi:MAG: 2TM domain-containing protein [Anaerolineae bacterium]|nr:2TM domain-containing protein [Anaerolineae bacterium]